MKRGDIVLCADKGADFTSKPRPVVIVQRTAYLASKDSVIVCPISTVLVDDELSLRLEPASGNGLQQVCEVRADKVSTVKKSRIGEQIGALSSEQSARLDDLLRDWLVL